MGQNELEFEKSYARCVDVSRRIRWEIDKDVIRGRSLDFSKKFLPDSVSRVAELDFLEDTEKTILSQIQGRTYAHMFGLVERFITAHTLKLANAYWLGDQNALRALIGFGEEELKHQELFLRLEELTSASMPEGYRFVPDTNEVAKQVLAMSAWTVLALTSLIENFTQSHYRESIAPEVELSELFKDVFLFHWREESQHTIIDELEWRKIDAVITQEQRDKCVDELIALLTSLDRQLQLQANADSEYFFGRLESELSEEQKYAARNSILGAYRWLFIDSGIEQQRFNDILYSMINAEQKNRIKVALVTMRRKNVDIAAQ